MMDLFIQSRRMTVFVPIEQNHFIMANNVCLACHRTDGIWLQDHVFMIQLITANQ